MAVKLRIKNPSLEKDEPTYLTSDYSSGTTLTVRNNEGFTDDWFVVVGEPGQEQTEDEGITSTTNADTITMDAALNFSHPKSTPVYQSRWNRLYVYRASSENGTYSAITNAETSNGYWNIEWDDSELSTMVIDNSGSSSSYYKWRFNNSDTGTYSAYSDILPGSGLARGTAGYVIKQVKKNTLAHGVSEKTMYEFMNDLQETVYESSPKAWWFSKEGTAVATVADTYKYSISSNWSDFNSMKYLLFNYVNGSTDETYPLKFVTELEFRNFKADANQASSDNVSCWTFLPPDSDSAKGYLGIDPTPETADCYIQPVYYIELTELDSFSDTLVIPKTKIYVDYVLYRISDDIRNDTSNATKYNSRVNAGLIALKQRAKRQKGQMTWIRYRGQKGYNRMFGSRGRGSVDDYREKYW